MTLGLSDVPDALGPVTDRQAAWTDPELLLSQTCGFPLIYNLGARAQLVATPVYDVEGCHGPSYSSVILVREGVTAQSLEDLRGCTAAFNGPDSQSGYNCLRFMAAPLSRDGEFFVGQALALEVDVDVDDDAVHGAGYGRLAPRIE